MSLLESVSQLKEELRETTCQQAAKDREAREQQKGMMELQNKLSIAETMLQTEKAVSLDLTRFNNNNELYSYTPGDVQSESI